MAEAATLTTEQEINEAANSLVEAPDNLPAETPIYDPGTLERPPTHGDLTIEEAADLMADDEPPAPNERAVTTHNGEPLTLSQLKQGFALAETLMDVVGDLHQRYALVDAASRNVITAASALANFITDRLPPAPRAELAHTNPAEFVRARAAHDEARAVIEEVVNVSRHVAHVTAEQAGNGLVQRLSDVVALQRHRFLECMPESADPKWGERVAPKIREVAYECGFTQDEFDSVLDHRVLLVLYLATFGLEQERKKAAAPRPKKHSERPRLVASRGGSITFADAMEMDFD